MGVNEAPKNHAEEYLTRINISITIENNWEISRISTILDLHNFYPFWRWRHSLMQSYFEIEISVNILTQIYLPIVCRISLGNLREAPPLKKMCMGWWFFVHTLSGLSNYLPTSYWIYVAICISYFYDGNFTYSQR